MVVPDRQAALRPSPLSHLTCTSPTPTWPVAVCPRPLSARDRPCPHPNRPSSKLPLLSQFLSSHVKLIQLNRSNGEARLLNFASRGRLSSCPRAACPRPRSLQIDPPAHASCPCRRPTEPIPGDNGRFRLISRGFPTPCFEAEIARDRRPPKKYHSVPVRN